MPRAAVPVTRWTMKGTVFPASVVVCAIALGAGGFAGSYATNCAGVAVFR
jgi:hypothetical protein